MKHLSPPDGRVWHVLYVRIPQAIDYCRMGWNPTPALEDTNHGEWSVAMEWLCDCKMPRLKNG
jgi:hypothetical protein